MTRPAIGDARWMTPPHARATGPIVLAYVTSCRELARDERVGRDIVDPMTDLLLGRREGLLESLARRLAEPTSELGALFRLGAIVCDDEHDECAAAWSGAPLWPEALAVPSGMGGALRPLAELRTRVGSGAVRRVRRLPGESEGAWRGRRLEEKRAHERPLADALAACAVDLVLTDSYMVVFEGDMLDAFDGRMLNVHPGVTIPDHPARLVGATPTRDAFTRARHGWVIVDDKRAVEAPEGETIVVVWEGRERRAVRVPPVAATGVTVHVVTREVDAGAPVACADWSFDPATATPESIRHRNYEIKREIVPRALLAYARSSEGAAAIERARAAGGRRAAGD